MIPPSPELESVSIAIEAFRYITAWRFPAAGNEWRVENRMSTGIDRSPRLGRRRQRRGRSAAARPSGQGRFQLSELGAGSREVTRHQRLVGAVRGGVGVGVASEALAIRLRADHRMAGQMRLVDRLDGDQQGLVIRSVPGQVRLDRRQRFVMLPDRGVRDRQPPPNPVIIGPPAQRFPQRVERASRVA